MVTTKFIATQNEDGGETIALLREQPGGLFRRASSEIVPVSEWPRAAPEAGQAALALARALDNDGQISEEAEGIVLPPQIVARLDEADAFGGERLDPVLLQLEVDLALVGLAQGTDDLVLAPHRLAELHDKAGRYLGDLQSSDLADNRIEHPVDGFGHEKRIPLQNQTDDCGLRLDALGHRAGNLLQVTAAAVVGGDLRKTGVKQDLNDQLVDLAAGILLMRLRPFLDEVADDSNDVVGEFRVLDTHEVA